MPTDNTGPTEGDPGTQPGTQEQAGGTQPQGTPPQEDLSQRPDVQALVAAAVAQAKKDAQAELRKKSKADEDKKKAEQEQDYQKLYEDAVRELGEKRVMIVRAQASSLAAKLNAVDPDAIASMIPADTEDDEDSVKSAVAAIKAKHPRLFQAGNAAGGAATTGAGGSTPQNADDMNMQIRRLAGRTQ